MDQSAFAKSFEDYLTNIDELVRTFVKESDVFGQHRNGLLQKESSLSILKSQKWNDDVTSSLKTVEAAVKEEFSKTETAKKSIDSQHSKIQYLEREVETQLKRLLQAHQKLRSCLRGACLLAENARRPNEVQPEPVDSFTGYASFDSAPAAPVEGSDGAPMDYALFGSLSKNNSNNSAMSDYSFINNARGFKNDTGAIPIGRTEMSPWFQSNQETQPIQSSDPMDDIKKPIDKNVVDAISRLVGDMSIRDKAMDSKREIEKDNNLSKILQSIKAEQNKAMPIDLLPKVTPAQAPSFRQTVDNRITPQDEARKKGFFGI